MKKLSKGFTLVELLVVIGILGMLMAVLFPKISDVMLSANLSTQSMHGVNVIKAIIVSNTDRAAKQQLALWPMQDTTGMTDRDSSLIGASSSKDYFNKLLDLEKKGTDQHDPFVGDVGPDDLSGPGMPVKQGKGELDVSNIAWVMVQNAGDEQVESTAPVMVSRNVNYTELEKYLISYNGEDTKVNCGSGTYKTPFGNKGWVVIYKGGGAKTFKAKDSRLPGIFSGPFEYSDLEMKFLPL